MPAPRATHLDKDDRRSNVHHLVKLDKTLIFLFLIATVEIKLTDALDSQLLMLECDLVGIRCKSCGILYHVVWKRGREENDLNIVG